MIVKPPLQSQCQRLPIKGCGELVDGVLLYVQGDKDGALEKIKQAQAANGPEQLKPFAKALRDAASLPGAEGVAAPMNEIAALLDPARPPEASTSLAQNDAVPGATSNKPAPNSSNSKERLGDGARARLDFDEKLQATEPAKPAVAQQDPATRALSATTDLTRVVTETVDLSIAEGRTPCKVAGLDALCVKVKEGPIIVTDVIGARTCPERVFVVATLSDTPDFGFRWSFESGPTPLTGAHLLVSGGDWLQLAIVPGKKGASNSAECEVTWSGFRPWIVPGK
jgi:hypothetical protein